MRKLFPGALVFGALFGFSSCTEKPLTAPGVPPPADTLVSFAGDVQPLFTTYGCRTCHGSSGQSNYSVGSYQTVFGPGDQATSRGMLEVRAGNPDSSYLVWKLEGNPPWPINGSRMPQNGPPFMTATAIATIRTWIRQGALDN